MYQLVVQSNDYIQQRKGDYCALCLLPQHSAVGNTSSVLDILFLQLNIYISTLKITPVFTQKWCNSLP